MGNVGRPGSGIMALRGHGVFEGFRSPQGDSMVLEQNLFVEGVLPGAIQRRLSDEEMDHYLDVA